MAADWESKRLSELAQNVSRPFKFSEHEKVVFVNTGDVLEGDFLHQEYSSKEGLPGQAKKMIERGDILFSEIRPANKRFAFVDKEYPEYVVSTKFMTIQSMGDVLPKYLYYVLTADSLLKEIQEIAESRSGTFPQITFDSIAHLPIKYPPKTKQQRLVNLFDAIDRMSFLIKRINTNYESIAQNMFRSWFVDFDPVKAKMKGKGSEGIDPQIAAIFPDRLVESELGMTPEGWDVVEVGQFLNVLETGKRPKGGVAQFKDGIPSIGAENVLGVGKYDYSKTKYIPIEFFGNMRRGILQSEDVLLYKDGGKPGVFRPRVSMVGYGFPFESAAINEHVFRIRSQELGQQFLYFLFRSDWITHELAERGGKAAIPGINQKEVKSLKFLKPSGKVIELFNELAIPLTSPILINAKQNRTLVNIRSTLLPKLISGEIQIPAE